MLDFAVKVTGARRRSTRPTSRPCAGTGSRSPTSGTSGRWPPSSASQPHGEPGGHEAQTQEFYTMGRG
jgi:hypothetical protein